MERGCYSRGRLVRSRRLWSATFLAAISLAAQGCARHRTVAVQPPAATTQPAARGLTSFKILTENTTGSRVDDSKYQEVSPPRPIGELELPDYPEKALKTRFGSVVVAVRVSLDATGLVAEIKDSPAGVSTGGRFAAEFRSAVEEAVRQWKFQPAEYRQYEDGKDMNGDGRPDYMILISAKPVPVYFDVRFDFSIVRGEGRVQTR